MMTVSIRVMAIAALLRIWLVLEKCVPPIFDFHSAWDAMCTIVLRLCTAAVRAEFVPHAGRATALRQIRLACWLGPSKPCRPGACRLEAGQCCRGESGRRG